MKQIINAFHDQRIAKVKGLNFIVNPLLDHDPETTSLLMRDVVKELSKLTDFSKADKIIGEEDRGGYIAALMAYHCKKSLGMVKWNPLDLKGEIGIDFRNAYTSGKLYLYGVQKGDKVILIEDLVDTGGTIIGMIKLLKKRGVVLKDVICVTAKEDLNGLQRIKKETGVTVKVLLKFNCLSHRSKVTEVLGKKVNLKIKNIKSHGSLKTI